ncbi:MAG: hypothetical protein ACLP07_12175 [Terracidiphilus sp.]
MSHAFSNQASLDPSKRSPFALRHPFLIHGILVVLCWLTYLLDQQDVVWRFIKGSPNSRLLEHLAFALAAVCIGRGVLLGAWPSGNRDGEVQTARSIRRRSLGEILHAVGIASLLPVSGSIVLVCAEALRSIHYARLRVAASTPLPAARANAPNPGRKSAFPHLLLRHIAGICAFLSMLVFSITLSDRVADALFAATALAFIVTRYVDAG